MVGTIGQAARGAPLTGSPAPAVTDEEVEAAALVLFERSDYAIANPGGTLLGPNDFRDDAHAALEAAAAVRTAAASVKPEGFAAQLGRKSAEQFAAHHRLDRVSDAICDMPTTRRDLDRMSEAIRALPGAQVVGRAIGDGR